MIGRIKLSNPSPYVLGKINNLYTVQTGIGQEKLILPAVMSDNLSVSFRYSGGFCRALLKPYYLKLTYRANAQDLFYSEQHKYSRADSARFLNANNILGASAWTKGIIETLPVPGAYIETAFAITPGKNRYFVQMITLGINASMYAKVLPIMADQQAYRWQVCLFAGLAIGERWK